MTEIQRWNATPLSQEIRKLLPWNASQNQLFILQWIRQTLMTAEATNQDLEMELEEMAEMEALTFSDPKESGKLYRILAPVSGEPYNSSEMVRKAKQAEKQVSKAKDEDLTPAQLELLQMFRENLEANGADLHPSLHAEDR